MGSAEICARVRAGRKVDQEDHVALSLALTRERSGRGTSAAFALLGS